MVIGRRGFFGFMGGAGVAAPSLAKEAASKMGLQAGGSGSMAAKIAALQSESESESFSAPNAPMSPESWLRHELKGMWERGSCQAFGSNRHLSYSSKPNNGATKC